MAKCQVIDGLSLTMKYMVFVLTVSVRFQLILSKIRVFEQSSATHRIKACNVGVLNLFLQL